MRYNVIAIEREYASGGSEAGQKLSMKLGIPCYGREILEEVARMEGTTPGQIEHLEETATNSFLYSIAMISKAATGDSTGLSRESALYLAEARVITEMVAQGPCILVGRCAGWVLKERNDLLRVFIHADMEKRKERAVSEYGISADKAENVLKRFDKRRSNFYSANSGRKWDNKEGYDLILDSGRLSIDKCVDIICEAVK